MNSQVKLHAEVHTVSSSSGIWIQSLAWNLCSYSQGWGKGHYGKRRQHILPPELFKIFESLGSCYLRVSLVISRLGSCVCQGRPVWMISLWVLHCICDPQKTGIKGQPLEKRNTIIKWKLNLATKNWMSSTQLFTIDSHWG